MLRRSGIFMLLSSSLNQVFHIVESGVDMSDLLDGWGLSYNG